MIHGLKMKNGASFLFMFKPGKNMIKCFLASRLFSFYYHSYFISMAWNFSILCLLSQLFVFSTNQIVYKKRMQRSIKCITIVQPFLF